MGFVYSQLFVTPTCPTQSLAGQNVIVTGSNTGLGKEAARHLARLGASKVILAVRNTKAGEAARKDIIATTACSADAIEVWPLDLSSYSSVQAFAQRAERDLDRLDVVLENAGIATMKYSQAEGHERTLTVNVISTFLLALLLLPTLKRTAADKGVQPRLVIVSSEVHAWTKFRERDSDKGIFPALDDEATANMDERYQTSKLLEVLAVRHIAPKLAGSGVILNCLNPGLCRSELARDLDVFVFKVVTALLARTTEVGSRTLVAAAVAGKESHGKYMTNGKADDGALSRFVRSARGKEVAEKLWAELKQILENIQTGVTAGF